MGSRFNNGEGNPDDVIQPIPISLKHIVKYKSGDAIYFLTEIYTNLNSYYGKGKNKMFVNLKRVRNKPNVNSSSDYFVEVIGGRFSDKFEMVDFDTDISVDDRAEIMKRHKKDVEDQVRWIQFMPDNPKVPLIDDGKLVELTLKTIKDVDSYIYKERRRRIPLKSGENPAKTPMKKFMEEHVNAGLTGIGEASDNPWGDAISGSTITSGANNYNTLCWDSNKNQVVMSDGTTLSPAVPAPMGNPCNEMDMIDSIGYASKEYVDKMVSTETDEPIVIRKNKRKSKIVRINEEPTIIL